MRVDISSKSLGSKERHFSDLVASVSLVVEKPIIAELRQLIAVTIDRLKVVIVPTFM